jgi:sulfoxide reductase heme-binding subunit YedZ
LLLMLPLAATSFNRAIRGLGANAGRRCTVPCTPWRCWRAALLLDARGKNDFAEVAVYAAVLGVLLGWRLAGRRVRWTKPNAAPAPS